MLALKKVIMEKERLAAGPVEAVGIKDFQEPVEFRKDSKRGGIRLGDPPERQARQLPQGIPLNYDYSGEIYLQPQDIGVTHSKPGRTKNFLLWCMQRLQLRNNSRCIF